MNIVVCIKQVPETTEIKIDPETKTLVRSGVASIINPFDEYAIEEGVRLKERLGAGTVTVLTMGPPQAEAALRDAVARGVDEMVLVSDRKFAGSDTWSTSRILAQAIRKLGPVDLVITGKQAIDGDTAQVGPGISVHLGLPQLAYVSEVMEIAPGKAKMKRMADNGYEIFELPLPAVITVVKEINVPRLPSLKGKMRARKAAFRTWTCADLGMEENTVGLKGSPTRVVEIFSPPRPTGGQIIAEADVTVAADRLVTTLKAERII